MGNFNRDRRSGGGRDLKEKILAVEILIDHKLCIRPFAVIVGKNEVP